jgi:hypothetical protein
MPPQKDPNGRVIGVLGSGRSMTLLVRTAKLTESDVQTIRRDHQTGTISLHALAKQYGVDRRTVRDVVNRVTWMQVPDLPVSGVPALMERPIPRYVVVCGNVPRHLWVD